MLLDGKNAVVTGCNRGIGKVILEIFARNGANVWACARKHDDDLIAYIEELKVKYNINITPIFFDLSDADSVKEGAKQILADKFTIDILVNSAGTISTSLFQMTSMKQMKDMFEVNYFSIFQFTQILVKGMVKNGGSIINIASSAAIEGNAGRVSYASSKSALITFSQVLSRELGRYNIRVNSVAPGLTDTSMMRKSTPDDILEQTLSRVSLGRIAEPIEIANSVLFLASDLSSYMTGHTLRVDGGM